ncbi:MAG: butyrate kinase [Deltaproteobacteria bacterium]|jgi:butyrate kinase|nr:butyrate kinase [Deltaproteobacteria bacterium]
MTFEILVINPGGTTTKIGWFQDAEKIFAETIEHDSETLKQYAKVRDQLSLRLKAIIETTSQHGVKLENLAAVVARAGLLPPLEAGAYEVNQAMINWSLEKSKLNHGSDLSGILAKTIAEKTGHGCKAYIYDGETLDQLTPLARYSGVASIPRTSLGHLLNMRAVGRRVADRLGKSFDELNMAVCHMGGGTSLCAIKKSRVIDTIPDDEGPCSVERSGKVPLKHIISLCYALPRSEVMRILRQDGGLKSYLGTNDGREIVRRIEAGGPEGLKAREVFEAMAYQVAKSIGEMVVALKGQVDAIVLTGGLAKSRLMTSMIEDKVSFFAPVLVEPGEYELEALAGGALRVLRGEESLHVFNY